MPHQGFLPGPDLSGKHPVMICEEEPVTVKEIPVCLWLPRVPFSQALMLACTLPLGMY